MTSRAAQGVKRRSQQPAAKILPKSVNQVHAATSQLLPAVPVKGFGPISPSVSEPEWQLQALYDFNRDGQPDAVWRNRGTGQNAIWLMRNNALYEVVNLPAVLDQNWQIRGAGLVGGFDLPPCLVWYKSDTGEVGFWVIDQRQVTAMVVSPHSGKGWYLGAVMDVNWDGVEDLVWHNSLSGEVGAWLMLDYGTRSLDEPFTGRYVSTVISTTKMSANWRLVGGYTTWEFGSRQLLWYDKSASRLRVWSKPSLASFFDAPRIFSLRDGGGAEWDAVGFTDLNGDRLPDIAWRTSRPTKNNKQGIWFLGREPILD